MSADSVNWRNRHNATETHEQISASLGSVESQASFLLGASEMLGRWRNRWSPAARRLSVAMGALLMTGPQLVSEDFLDRAAEVLTVNAFDDRVRARVSGALDLEAYHFQQPAPGLIVAKGDDLLNPRLTLFLDAQIGTRAYFFAQARQDRGFDPGRRSGRARLDEYALRFTPLRDQRFNVQVGKFATVVGNWVTRHASWENPFISAPLAYEQVTGIWDASAALSSATLLDWAGVRSNNRVGPESDKSLRVPIVWGPSYATGAAVSGEIGRFRYAFEAKNAGLSSRPVAWESDREQWHHPTFSGRIGYRPNATWNFGASASAGPYLWPSAGTTLAPGYGLGDYRQLVLAHDLSFARRHWQIWAEVFASRFEIPTVAEADVLSYYVEARYKFTPQFFGALRWNQQVYARIPDRGGHTAWGHELWRIDFAPTYRFTPHVQLKCQYSLQHGDTGVHAWGQMVSAQLTTRF